MMQERPHVILNSAMSLDGKIASRTGQFQFSSILDRKRVHRLRSQVDGIMVGVRTVLIDNPKLTVKYVKGRNPTRIIVDSNARTPINSYVVRTARIVPTIIAVTKKASRRKIHQFQKTGVTVLYCGNQKWVSLRSLMRQLRRQNINTVLLEGGGTLNWNMLKQGLVDELSIAISPQIIGGKSAVTLAEGRGAANSNDTVKLRLLKLERYGPDLVLYYKVLS